MKIKEKGKSYIKQSPNGTIYYLDRWGDKWYDCEPFKVLYIKYNQYLIDRNGSYIRISQMNQKEYEYSAYLYEDVKKNGSGDDRLENEIREMYSNLL